MNKHGENIVLKVNKDKCLAGFYALGFEPKEIMGVLYQAIIVLCKEQGLDSLSAVQHDDDVYHSKSVIVTDTKPKIPIYQLGE